MVIASLILALFFLCLKSTERGVYSPMAPGDGLKKDASSKIKVGS